MMSQLKTRLKEYRARKELTQGELANLVDVRRETISHLEKGKYNPSLKLAIDIAKILDERVEVLFYYIDEQ